MDKINETYLVMRFVQGSNFLIKKNVFIDGINLLPKMKNEKDVGEEIE